MTAVSGRVLSLPRVLVGMVGIPWVMRRPLFTVLSRPAALIVALVALWNVVPLKAPLTWILVACYWLLIVYFAVRCHRVVLLGAARAYPGEQWRWTWRETRFALLAAVVYAGWLAVWMAVTPPLGTVLSLLLPRAIEPAPAVVAIWLGLLLAAWLMGRLSLVLPATALDESLSFSAAWRLSRGNGWRLMILVGVVPSALGALRGSLYREGASALEQSLLLLLTIPLLVVAIAALSLSYRELTGRDASPTGEA